MFLHRRPSCALGLSALLLAGTAPGALAAADSTEARLAALQEQVNLLQHEIKALRRRPVAAAPVVVAAPAHGGPTLLRGAGPLGAPLPPSGPSRAQAVRSTTLIQYGPSFVQAQAACGDRSFALGALCFTPGGFVELAGFYRTPNEGADIASDFGGIPFRNSLAAREGEFRFSARQSRLSGLVTGQIDPTLKISGYAELDFLGAGVTSNSRESNSYVPRVRQVWAAADMSDLGLHLLAGQAFSLITTNLSGITPLKEQTPLTIDAQYVPGFNWVRAPQLRAALDMAPGLWAAAALETPQAVLPPGPFAAPNGTIVNVTGDAGGLNNSTTTYSINEAPDVVAKVAYEPGWGHYELKGVGRMLEDRVIGHTNSEAGYGLGAAASLPVLPDFAEIQLSGLFGRGIGRYGSAQLPDMALRADGSVAAVPMFQALAGLIVHVQPGTDVYAYGGWEHAERAGALSLAGYGSPTLVVSGCDTEGATTATCQAESRDVRQITAGFWHDLYKGVFGRVVAGAQASYTTRDAFRGVAGIAPTTHMTVGLASLRYYPF